MKKVKNADELFFLSLLPDMKKLSEPNNRRFKIETMTLINNMLEKQPESRVTVVASSTSPSGNFPFDLTLTQDIVESGRNFNNITWDSSDLDPLKQEQSTDD